MWVDRGKENHRHSNICASCPHPAPLSHPNGSATSIYFAGSRSSSCSSLTLQRNSASRSSINCCLGHQQRDRPISSPRPSFLHCIPRDLFCFHSFSE